MSITVKSFFSGIGGMDLGLAESGLEIVESYEIDKKACETLRRNFKHTIRECDITKLTVLDQPHADVYVGTFPCQHYSKIADINGTRNGDALFLDFFRHIAIATPEMFIIENVPGMLKFKVVMECFTKLPGYYVRVECPIDAKNWLPQKRERVFIIGTKKPFNNISYPDNNPVKMKDIIEVGAKVHTPAYVSKRLNGNYRDLPIITDLEGIAPTCVAHYSKDRSTRLINDGISIRPYSKLEYARLQGFPDWFSFYGTDNDAYRQIGNAVAVPVARWIGKNVIRYFNNYFRNYNDKGSVILQ
ncbi:MAG: DNA (cytosine-5-)-methyltransferase [Tissierellales bacterium]|jgi:DNA (cytosine-5)-methyltransferase 1|nr:DNA (cytosine-5-)-methyltransferase [Tissierellales bacterium]